MRDGVSGDVAASRVVASDNKNDLSDDVIATSLEKINKKTPKTDVVMMS